MKILHVINNLAVGGAQKLILDTLPLYRDLGLDVDLAILTHQQDDFLSNFKENFDGEIYDLGNKSEYDPRVIIPLAKLMRAYDIVHVHLFPAQYFAVIANKFNRNESKLIFTEHCTSNRRMQYKVLRPLEKLIYHNYDKNISITPEIKEILKSYVGINGEEIPVIQNGVDLEKIEKAQPLQRKEIDSTLEEGDIIITQIAAFRLQKNHPTIIRAMLYLPENFKLLLVGNGEEKGNCEALTKKLNLSHRIIFLGRRSDIPELLKSVDYVVLSSHFEGLSLSSIEGMASGKPFIASDVPGLTEIVKGYGVMFKDGDEKELADKIIELYNNPELYQQIVEKCQMRAKEFDIKHMINQHIALYQTMGV